jgi:hypothetical protein
MYRSGFYMSSHDDCTRFDAHRHPVWENADHGKRLPQPKRVLVEVPATVTYEVVLDTDGTARVRAASYVVTKDALDAAPTDRGLYRAADELGPQRDWQDPEVARLYEEADAAWERVLDAVTEWRDGECAVDEGWTHQWPAPVLDEAVEA